MSKIVKNDLYDYENRYIFQFEDAFKFSLDSILLAEFVDNIKSSSNILDLCTGNAAIPLILTTKVLCHIDAIEIQKEIYELGKKSISYNNLDDYIKIYNFNATEINNHIQKKYDIITCNPPYFKVDKSSFINKNEKLQIARHEIKITLEDIFKISNNYLNTGGSLYLVHIPERLDEIIYLGFKYKLNIKKVQFIKTKENKKPSLVLVKAVRDSKSGLKINDIINVENKKTYKNIFKEV